LSQLDLEKALATSQKTKVAASEYAGFSLQSPSRWSVPGESGDSQIQAAINEFSKLVVSHMINLQPESQDP